jgi:hypothetical protein
MDDELLREVYHFLFHGERPVRTADCTFPDAVIVLIHLFRALRQLSAAAAMDKRRWPLWLRRLKFPSYSQFNRRVKTAAVAALLAELSGHFRSRLPCSSDKAIDGKPLIVGGFSKDPDAQRGKVPAGWARGYKLHAIVDAGGAVEAWDVTSLLGGEPTVGRDLAARVDLRGAVLRGDSNYDSNGLYAAVADRGGRLIAPRKKPGRGLGNTQHHPHRLQAIAELETGLEERANHAFHRNRVEQAFGQLTCVSFGLWGLPPSVRRLDRVRLWVAAKIALYHTLRWLQLRHSTASPAA